jgi:hypothetical protein
MIERSGVLKDRENLGPIGLAKITFVRFSVITLEYTPFLRVRLRA